MSDGDTRRQPGGSAFRAESHSTRDPFRGGLDPDRGHGRMLSVLIAERYVPSREQLLIQAARLRRNAALRTEPGAGVRYLGAAFVPQDETCFLVFEAGDAVEVERLLAREEITCQRIVQAICLPAGSDTPEPRLEPR